MGRRWAASREWATRRWVWIASALAGLAVVATFGDFGITWDEGVQSRYGELVLAHFRTGGEDRRWADYQDLRYYGPAVEAGLAFLYQPWPALRFDIRHLVLGLLAVALIPVIALHASRFGRAAAAPLAVLALVAMPRLVGHAPNNSKDVPFALAIALFMATLAPLIAERGRPGWTAVASGAAAGLVLAIRPGGAPLLVAFVALALVLAHLVRLLPRERAALGALALRLLVAGAVGWVAMVACWPWAHEAPVANPLRAILQATDFDRVYPVLYAGRHFPSDALPRHYLPVYLLITTPLPLLALAALGAVAEIRRARADADPARRFALGLTLVWLALPVALVIALGPNLYDGMRHFLFVLPAIAVLAGLGAWHAATRLSAGRLGRGAWLVVGLVVLSPLVSMARLHPYQTSYFNAFVGGLSGAEGRFEVDYWATSLREATEFVNAHAPATTQARGRPVRLLVGTTSPYPKIAVEYAAVAGIEVLTLAELARWSGEPPAIDYYVAPDRYGMQGFFDAAPIVHRVRRDGVTLAVVRDMGGAPVRPTSAPAEVGTGPSGSAHRAD